MIETILLILGVMFTITWIVLLICIFVLDYMKGTGLYHWVKKHIITDEDLDTID